MKFALYGTFGTTDATYVPLEPKLSSYAILEAHRGILEDTEVPTRAQIESYIRKEAIRNNLPPSWAVNIAICESGLNPQAIGDDGEAFGLFQYHRKTWNSFLKMYLGTTDKDIFDWRLQAIVTMKAFKDDKWNHWYNCMKNNQYGFAKK